MSAVVYRFTRQGVADELSFPSIERALHRAVNDHESGQAQPELILKNGVVLLDQQTILETTLR
ncbi:MAG: hypothetical protein AB1758_36500 [Candidatus Eremiobacterota bacterium]